MHSQKTALPNDYVVHWLFTWVIGQADVFLAPRLQIETIVW